MGQRQGIVEEVLALRRIRPGSLSYGHDPERTRGYLLVVREAIERRRRREAASGMEHSSG
jgi:hypothetical protein